MRITLRKSLHSLKLVFVIFTTGFIRSVIACPSGSTVLNTGSYKICYWYHDHSHKFEKMNEECADLYVPGSTLAEIPDNSALSTIASMSVPSGISWPVWIGYTDEDVEGTFKSINGFPDSNLIWKPGEPDGGTNQNCVVLFNDDWTIRTRSCSDNYNSICSKVEEVTTTSTTVTTTQTTSADLTVSSSTTLPTTSTSTTPETTSTTSITTTTETTSATTNPQTTTSTTSSSTTTDITTRATENTTQGKCFCTRSCYFNITEEELQHRIDEIKSILLLDVKNLSAFKRSKVSVYENRPIPAGLGALGISMMCFVAIPLLLTDVIRCVKWLWSNQKDKDENDEL